MNVNFTKKFVFLFREMFDVEQFNIKQCELFSKNIMRSTLMFLSSTFSYATQQRKFASTLQKCRNIFSNSICVDQLTTKNFSLLRQY